MNSVSSLAFLGSNRGIAGCSRMVSLTTACKYINSFKSSSSTALDGPTTPSISALSFIMESGLRNSSAIAHTVVLLVVSVPPKNISCTITRCFSVCLLIP